jgi:transcriptional regulator with XRE-family HTH domain
MSTGDDVFRTEDGTPMTFAAGVKALRERLGLTTDRLARELGLSRRTVEGWEQGREPSYRAYKGLVMFLGRPDPPAAEAGTLTLLTQGFPPVAFVGETPADDQLTRELLPAGRGRSVVGGILGQLVAAASSAGVRVVIRTDLRPGPLDES